ncbi:hypothetical protein C2G38_2151481 [Gigaspora rosea]|uniref:Uncharacterized protein n=1 Tax=Gigaspora rosea TaxID=44941 RepID=A0A397WB35_9GLOM|nr:hypothetical protein C2G38_2151481 [Gigaspora rosea]
MAQGKKENMAIYIAKETAPANASANAIVDSIKSYIDQNMSMQMNMISKMNEYLDAYMNQQQTQKTQKKSKVPMIAPGLNHDYDPATTTGSSTVNQKQIQPQQGAASCKTLQHLAQFKLAQNITTDEALTLQSVNETISAVPPPFVPMTDTERHLLLQLDPCHFNIQIPINTQAFKSLTISLPKLSICRLPYKWHYTWFSI